MSKVLLDNAQQIEELSVSEQVGIAALARAGVGDSINLAREEHLTQARAILETLPSGEERDRLRDAVCMVATLFKMLARESLLSTEALMLINRMQLPLVRMLIGDAAVLGDARHPARLLLQDLCAALLGVSADIGAEVIYDPIREVIKQLEQAEILTDDILQKSLTALRDELGALNKRIERIEEKVRQSELGRERTEVAQHEVIAALNVRLKNVSLPPSVTRFLHGPWRDSLKLVWVRSGPDSKAWSQGLQLTEFLLWALHPGNAETDSQRFYNGMPLLLKGLTVGLISLSHDPTALERALSEVNDELLKILKKEERYCEPAAAIPDDLDAQRAMGSELDAVLAQVDALKPGDWLLMKHEGGALQHCKIAVISRQTQRFILVNRMGMRLCEKTRAELALDLYRQQVRILGAASLFERVLSQTMASLHDAFVMQEKRRALERVQQEEKKRQMEAELQAQQLAQEMALARQQAEERERQRLQEEAENVRQKEAERLLLQQALEQEKTQTQPLEVVDENFNAEEAASNLNVGGWIELQNGEHMQRCKLAVRIKQTNRFIFVDRIGVKVAELGFAEVVEMLRDHRMRILHSGESFNRALETVVKNNRNDTKPIRSSD